MLHQLLAFFFFFFSVSEHLSVTMIFFFFSRDCYSNPKLWFFFCVVFNDNSLRVKKNWYLSCKWSVNGDLEDIHRCLLNKYQVSVALFVCNYLFIQIWAALYFKYHFFFVINLGNLSSPVFFIFFWMNFNGDFCCLND